MMTYYRQLLNETDDSNQLYIMLITDNFSILNTKLTEIQNKIYDMSISTISLMMKEVIILLVLVSIVLFLFIGSIFPIYYFV